MKRSLRKGSSSVYFEYADGGDSIGADTFEAKAIGNSIVLSFRLRPVDANQRIDEENIHAKQVLSISIDDQYIINKLTTYLRHHRVSSMVVVVLSKGTNLSFSVVPEGRLVDRLYLIVKREDG